MAKFLVVVALLAAVGVAVVIGCGPRGQVLADQWLAKIDKAIGDLEIKRKEIDNRITRIRDQARGVKENLYGARAKLEILEGKKTKTEKALEEIKAQLRELQGYVDEAASSDDKAVEIHGKKFDEQRLAELTDDIIASHERETTRLQGLEDSYTVLKKSVDLLEQQESTAESAIKKFEDKLGLLDIKRENLVDAREQSLISTENKSLSENIQELTKEVEDFSVDVEVEFQMEKDRLAEINSDSNDASDILKGLDGGIKDTQKRLADILGSSDE